MSGGDLGTLGAKSSLVVDNKIDALTEYHSRPGFGTKGRTITVEANMFATRFKGDNPPLIHHYDVNIAPVVRSTDKKMPKPLLWKLWKTLCAQVTGANKVVFDSAAFDVVKNMYTAKKFAGDEGAKVDFTVELQEDGREADDTRRFKVSFQLANKIDLQSIVDFCRGQKQTEKTKEMMLTALQAMNILFRQDATDRFTNVGAQGRRFFSTAGASPLPNAGECYLGFMQSFRFTQSGLPAMQLDTAYSAFVRPGPLHEVIGELLGLTGGGGGGFGGGRGGRGGFRGGRGGGYQGGGGGGGGGGGVSELTPQHIIKAGRILAKAKFKVSHRRTDRIFTLLSITKQPAGDLKFLLQGRDGGADRMVTIVEYYKQTYNVVVTKPRLPCVVYGKNNYIPLEFVVLEPFNSIPMIHLTGEQTAEMIKVSAKKPIARRDLVMRWRQELAYDKLPKVINWGVEVNTQMMKVEARVLPAPEVLYGNNGRARPNAGKWNMQGSNRFVKPGAPLKSWAIINFDSRNDTRSIQGFVSEFVQCLNQVGCPVANSRPEILSLEPRVNMFDNIKTILGNAARAAYISSGSMDPQMILCIVPRKDLAFKTELKRVAADGLQRAIVTQVMLGTQVAPQQPRNRLTYLQNMAMKVHAKMGGVTHMISTPLLDKNTLMIGADVTHPPPRGGMIPPSIAVSVGSVNAQHNFFWPSIRLQEGRKEIITDLANMVQTHIEKFAEGNGGAKPSRIIMFRDGVSEGQYGQVVDQELSRIRQAARAFGGDNYKPKITFVICAKRHHMRFYGINPADRDNSENLPAGTVVDKGVTHPFAFDFYLQSHAGLQGTARPTHYIVVSDENKFSPDEMQGLCNALCYSYARCTRAVSIVPVAYYADLIAGKCRDFVYAEDPSDYTPSVSSGSGGRESLEYDPYKLKKRIEDNLKFNSVAWYM